jgi:ketosteroid isomerase-like protein
MARSTGFASETTRRKALREAIHALYAARQTGDVDEFMSYFAPEARMTIVGNPVLNPQSGLRVGRNSIERYMRKVHDENVYLGHVIDQIVAEGDHVVVRWHINLRLAQNGREARFDALDHLRIRDNQIVELTQFYDTGTMALLKGRIRIA